MADVLLKLMQNKPPVNVFLYTTNWIKTVAWHTVLSFFQDFFWRKWKNLRTTYEIVHRTLLRCEKRYLLMNVPIIGACITWTSFVYLPGNTTNSSGIHRKANIWGICRAYRSWSRKNRLTGTLENNLSNLKLILFPLH